jgi:formylglycine-generating enzyme required for sulfatase activity
LLELFHSEFIAVTPGEGKFPASFLMGRAEGGKANERPVHKVTFGYRFHVARYEVPQDLWEAVMGSNPSRWKGKRNSVEMLSFAEAQEFCRKATILMRQAKLIKQNELIRLPTEAEWEYSARAGTTTLYSFGGDVSALDDGTREMPLEMIPRWEPRSQMPGDSTMSTDISGNGALIQPMTATRELRAMVEPG